MPGAGVITYPRGADILSVRKYLPPKKLAKPSDDVRSHWKLGPLPADHMLLQAICPACKELFCAGDYTALIPLGPGSNFEERLKCREGHEYTAIAIHVHWSCATGQDGFATMGTIPR